MAKYRPRQQDDDDTAEQDHRLASEGRAAEPHLSAGSRMDAQPDADTQKGEAPSCLAHRLDSDGCLREWNQKVPAGSAKTGGEEPIAVCQPRRRKGSRGAVRVEGFRITVHSID